MDELGREGIDVVAPATVAQHLDIPAIIPEIMGAMQQSERPVVVDVGGDAQGARALGQFAPTLKNLDYGMNFVVNPHRPFTGSIEGIARAIDEIQTTSRLRVSALVSNPNLMRKTGIDLVVKGHRLVEEAAKTLALPVAFISLRADLAAQVRADQFQQPVMPLRRFFVMSWEGDNSA